MASTSAEVLASTLEAKKQELLALQKRRREREARRAARPNSPTRNFDVNSIISSIEASTTLTVDVSAPAITLFDADGSSTSTSTGGGVADTAAVARLTAEVDELTTELANAKKRIFALEDNITYEKTTQTVQTDPWDSHADAGEEEGIEGGGKAEEDAAEGGEAAEGEAAAAGTEGADAAAVDEATTASAAEKGEEDAAASRTYSAAEVSKITSTSDFQDFMRRATRQMERCLHQNVHHDALTDYAGLNEEEDGGDEAGEAVALAHDFFDEKWCDGRAVTCVDWSPKFPELIACGYNANANSPNQPDGLVLIWNLRVPGSPEFVFTCETAVTAVCFSPFKHNIVVGGTYSGQVVLWDKRARATPVQRSALSSSSHTHPIYSMEIIGTQNAHNLVSISTDGMCCGWNLDIMQEPSETRELVAQQSKQQVAVTALSFPEGESNNFVVGSEEGVVFSASRQEGIAGQEFEGHAGPVTAVDCHCAAGNAEFAHLFVSASTDWSIKLWSGRRAAALASFENAGDYIYDVQWSPRHPALFAAVDGMGMLDFWNINVDAEVPVASLAVGEGRHALNRVKWALDGRALAVADADGHLFIYNIGERLATPRPDEYARLRATLGDMVALQEESAKASA